MIFFENISKYTLDEIYNSKSVLINSGIPNERMPRDWKIDPEIYNNYFIKYIKINKEFVKMSDSFSKKHFNNKKVLGVHFRGKGMNNTPNHPFGPTPKQMFLKVDQYLYPKLIHIGAISGFSRLVSNNLKIKSRECKFNPDWDGDIILKLFNLFAQNLKWTPPENPKIEQRIEGERFKFPLEHVKRIGLNKFIKQNNILSYAITNPNSFNYTVFKKYKNAK